MSTVAGIGLTGALTLNLLQYNLRSGMRDLWCLIAVSVLLHLVPRSTTAASPGHMAPDVDSRVSGGPSPVEARPA